jgi:hypothetical protein
MPNCFLQKAQLSRGRQAYDVDALLLYNVRDQPCMRFILVIGLQLIELPDSILESDRQR